MRKIDGRKAVVIDSGKQFTTYKDFAVKNGYPDAAAEEAGFSDKRGGLRNGDEVTLLVSGPHLTGYKGKTLWIVETTRGDRYIINGDGLKITEESEIQTLQRTVAGLTETVANLSVRLAAAERNLADHERQIGVEGGELVYSRPAEYRTPSFVKTKLTRDDVIERAKRDLAELTTKRSGKYADRKGCGNVTVEFVVNREKRTVVALLKLVYFPEAGVQFRGKSRCAPDDVFNSHIGRAIALRRALGLEVPPEYTDAPAPTDVRVGDIVASEGRKYNVMPPNSVSGRIYQPGSGECAVNSWRADNGRIIDDSREEVSV